MSARVSSLLRAFGAASLLRGRAFGAMSLLRGRAFGAMSLLRGRAFGAMIAQIWQAVGSFGLQLVAAWTLGAAGLGIVSLCLGIIVLATAVVSGMVGDTLVVLDRHDHRTRAGLEFWTLVVVPISMVGTSLALGLSGLLTGWQALIFAGALGAFQLEEIVRRVFTATMRFWRLLVIDSSAVVVALGMVGVAVWLHRIGVGAFLLGLLCGQLVGILVGVAMMPAAERLLLPLRGARVRAVAAFGAWRGAQVAVAPLILTAVRVIVTASVGAAALGQVEAARIFVAPAMLAVQGLGSYLLSSYAHDKHLDLSLLTTRAWRATTAMAGAAALGGALLIILGPIVGQLVIGPHIRIDRLTVAGWSLYVAASATLQPFASLAAARGEPAKVLACRTIDALTATAAVWVLLVPLRLSTSWVPYAMAGGLFLGGFLIRQLVLKPLRERQLTPTDVSTRTSYAT